MAAANSDPMVPPSGDDRGAQSAALAKQDWQDANRERIESSNAYVERHGLPLAQFRQF